MYHLWLQMCSCEITNIGNIYYLKLAIIQFLIQWKIRWKEPSGFKQRQWVFRFEDDLPGFHVWCPGSWKFINLWIHSLNKYLNWISTMCQVTLPGGWDTSMNKKERNSCLTLRSWYSSKAYISMYFISCDLRFLKSLTKMLIVISHTRITGNLYFLLYPLLCLPNRKYILLPTPTFFFT